MAEALHMYEVNLNAILGCDCSTACYAPQSGLAVAILRMVWYQLSLITQHFVADHGVLTNLSTSRLMA